MAVTIFGKCIGIVMFIALLFLTGCGSKASVSGRVTLGGQPVENGFVTFFPADDKGQSVGAQIINGDYSIDDITPGKKRVSVNITDPTASPPANTPKTRDEANAERLSMAKKRPKAGKNTTKITKLSGNDKTVEVGAGSQKIDIPLEKAETGK
jgi:hypothetical protein